MDELKMVPVNIFFPRSAASIFFHLKQKKQRVKKRKRRVYDFKPFNSTRGK